MLYSNPRLIPITHGNKRAWIYPEQGFQVHAFEQDMPNGAVAQVLCPVTTHLEPSNRHYGNPILFPNPGAVAGPIGKDSWTWKQKNLSMPSHGFARNTYWHTLEIHPDRVIGALYPNPETRLLFPFEFCCHATYQLNETGLVLDFEVRNPGTESFPYALGFHPYFSTPLGPKGSVADCSLKLPKAIRVTSKDHFVTQAGQAYPETVVQANQDIADSILLMESGALALHCVDHANGWTATVSSEGSSMDFPVWVVWSSSPEAPFICIEPWTDLPNALNRRETRFCPAGATHHYRLTISIRPS